jgi:2-methylcitrate dehydratase PrpD
MPKASISRQLARNLLSLRFVDLPPEVLDKAKACIVDCLASVLGGWDMPVSTAAILVAGQSAGATEATIWTGQSKATVSDAAFANTALAHSLLQEDTHIVTQSHPGSIVIPAALTLGETLHSGGREVLAAIVAGYEAVTGIGRGLVNPEFNQRGFRPSGVLGPFAACVVASRLLALDEDQTTNALGIAGNCAGGVMEFAYAGTRDFPLHVAFAVRNGITAALLAQQGASGPEQILEGRGGIGNAFAGIRTGLEAIGKPDTQALGIMETYSKAFPACGFVQATPQVALRLRREVAIPLEEIEEIIVGTFAVSATWPGTDYCGPFEQPTQAQMSHQFMLAAALADGAITPVTLRNRLDPRYAELAAKTRVEIDPECDRNYPPRQSARITVRLRDGRIHTVYEDDLHFPDRSSVVARFVSNAEAVLRDGAASRLLEHVDSLETMGDVAVIPSLLAQR